MTKIEFVALMTHKYAACPYCLHASMPTIAKTCQECFNDNLIVRQNFKLDEAKYNARFDKGACT